MADVFKKLECWRRSIDLSEDVYKITKKFPDDERFGMTSQIQRAVVSISNNICEGTGVGSLKHEINHLHIAVSSCNEVENLSILANRLGYITKYEQQEIEDLVTSTRKPLYGFIKFKKDKLSEKGNI
jgi:four helix bundle protein